MGAVGTSEFGTALHPDASEASIPALERGFAVLQALFEAPEGLAPRAIAERTGIPRTSLYRTLQVLTAYGYAGTLPDGSTYVLGPALLRMASRVPLRDDLAARAYPVLQKLVSQFQETAKVVVRDHLESVAIAVIHPRLDSRITSFVGSRLPLHVGASQHLLLSRAPQAVIEAALARAVKAGDDVQALRRKLADLAGQDWGASRGEGNKDGVGGVTALIREHGHPPRAVITVVFVASSKSDDEIVAVRDAVREAARALSTA